jgi:hypothetical protein
VTNESTEHPDDVDDAPARAEQPGRESFAEGEARPDEYAGEERVGDFAEGQEDREGVDEDEHIGRFSEGEEVLGEEDPEKHVEGRFSTGVDDLPPDAQPGEER